ncbi:Uncharacterised protein [BD1-7 clade bacterium]|uniref:Uncharacterized protein n=1 Tax=BD1-7 clade bacterium TaxID=2029982 RepID=A0A5S9PAK9_9GAMM|nr:Uncharacterised protein [BD1-7 clade bacterium]
MVSNKPVPVNLTAAGYQNYFVYAAYPNIAVDVSVGTQYSIFGTDAHVQHANVLADEYVGSNGQSYRLYWVGRNDDERSLKRLNLATGEIETLIDTLPTEKICAFVVGDLIAVWATTDDQGVCFDLSTVDTDVGQWVVHPASETNPIHVSPHAPVFGIGGNDLSAIYNESMLLGFRSNEGLVLSAGYETNYFYAVDKIDGVEMQVTGLYTGNNHYVLNDSGSAAFIGADKYVIFTHEQLLAGETPKILEVGVIIEHQSKFVRLNGSTLSVIYVDDESVLETVLVWIEDNGTPNDEVVLTRGDRPTRVDIHELAGRQAGKTVYNAVWYDAAAQLIHSQVFEGRELDHEPALDQSYPADDDQYQLMNVDQRVVIDTGEYFHVLSSNDQDPSYSLESDQDVLLFMRDAASAPGSMATGDFWLINADKKLNQIAFGNNVIDEQAVTSVSVFVDVARLRDQNNLITSVAGSERGFIDMNPFIFSEVNLVDKTAGIFQPDQELD